MIETNLKEILLFNTELKPINENKIEAENLLNQYIVKDPFFNKLLADLKNDDWIGSYYLNEAPSFRLIELELPKVFTYKIQEDSDEVIITFNDIYDIGGSDNGETFSLIEKHLIIELYKKDIEIIGKTKHSIYCSIESKKEINKILKKMKFQIEKPIFKNKIK